MWDELDIEAIVEDVKERLLGDSSPGLGVFVKFASSIGLDDEDDFDPRKNDQYRAAFAEYLDDEVRDLVNEQICRLQIDVPVENDELVIYRTIIVPVAWTAERLDDRPIGVCWSWDQQYAVAYVGGGSVDEDQEVRLTAAVDVAAVDLEATVALNACNEYWGEDEREIRLRDDAAVRVFGIDARPYGAVQFASFADLEGRNYTAGAQETLVLTI